MWVSSHNRFVYFLYILMSIVHIQTSGCKKWICENSILALHLSKESLCRWINTDIRLIIKNTANFTQHLLLYYCTDVQIHSFLSKKISTGWKEEQTGLGSTKWTMYRCYNTILTVYTNNTTQIAKPSLDQTVNVYHFPVSGLKNATLAKYNIQSHYKRSGLAVLHRTSAPAHWQREALMSPPHWRLGKCLEEVHAILL